MPNILQRLKVPRRVVAPLYCAGLEVPALLDSFQVELKELALQLVEPLHATERHLLESFYGLIQSASLVMLPLLVER